MLVPLVVVLALAGGVAGVVVLPSDSDAVDLDAAPSSGPTSTPPGPTATPSPDPAPGSPSPTEQVTALAASLSAVPAVDVTAQLADPRPELERSGTRLRRRVQAVLDELGPSLQGARLAVAVRDAQGRRVVDLRPDARLLPASTMKAVTAATVLHTLGPDHRFTTTAATSGEVTDGVLRGDLVLHGGGDPVLTTEDYRRHVYPSRPSTSLEDLADAVAAEGITVVTGRLVADAAAWGNAEVAAGWRTAYLDDQNARHITQLTVNAGLTVDVEIPEDAPVQVELHGARDPVRTAADVFAAELAERGISVRGGVATAGLPVGGTTPLAAVESPPVSELLAFTLQRSDNHLADTLLLAAGHAATGDGAWAAAQRTAERVLHGLGVDPTGLRVTDGSGLSRLDRLTAAQLADLDAAMTAGPHATAWEDSMAVAGERGTLRYRLQGTAAAGRFLGKTGTLDDVKAVVGHVRPTRSGQGPLHVAVVSNGAPAGGQWAVTVLMDRLALVLADHLDGCRTTWDADGAPTRTCGDG